MIVRPETEREFPAIHALVEVAFQTAKVTNGKEQDFVDQLRASSAYIPELALVAEENGRLIGHIMLTKTQIASPDGGKFETLFLGPVSVALEHRNSGVGSALINASANLAKTLGHSSIFLVGDPAYYHRFGFRPTANFGIRHLHDIPAQYVMALELTPNALAGVSGVFAC